MYLEKLTLTNFKNHEDERFLFSPAVNVIVGPNGSGKTNLLDAVYVLSLTKSAFQHLDALNIEHTADYMLVDGIFVRDEPDATRSPTERSPTERSPTERSPTERSPTERSPTERSPTERSPTRRHTQITVSLQRGHRKVVLADKKPYERVSDHIGRFPVVLLAPNDTDLVREHSEDRRFFFDGVLSQLDPDYLRDFLTYQQILKQRNSLLKLFYDRNQVDYDLLDTYDDPLLVLTERMHTRRKSFIDSFLPVFARHYAYLSQREPQSVGEPVTIIYESEATNPDFAEDFRRNRPRDIAAQRTTLGIHRDDYAFEIGGVALKKFGSQGQQKTFVVALKLAQFEQLTEAKGVKPILLLDDIFDKLDDRRIGKLIQRMDDGTFGQIFITDARPDRTADLLAHVQAEVRLFRIGSH